MLVFLLNNLIFTKPIVRFKASLVLELNTLVICDCIDYYHRLKLRNFFLQDFLSLKYTFVIAFYYAIQSR